MKARVHPDINPLLTKRKKKRAEHEDAELMRSLKNTP